MNPRGLSTLTPLLLMAVALAGCFQAQAPGESTPATTSQPVVGACTIGINQVPAHSTAGNFTVNVTPDCPYLWESSHIAAHWSNMTSEEATLAHYTNACKIEKGNHTAATARVECTITQPGTYYLRGHSIIGTPLPGYDGVVAETPHVWTDEYKVTVQAAPSTPPAPGSVTVTLWNLKSYAVANASYTYTVDVAWAIPPPGVPSNHTGSHWGTASSSTASTTAYPNTCPHETNATIPGTFHLSCAFANTATVYLRGHSRFLVDGQESNFWSQEVALPLRAA